MIEAKTSTSEISFPAEKTRLDLRLVELGLCPSRSRATDAIKRGCVTVDGRIIKKAGFLVNSLAEILVDDNANAYVSRAALKLVAALDASQFKVAGLCGLDIGASTGGFTQVLLERGASRVFAIDVGHGQMHPTIGENPKVTALEGLNARSLVINDIGGTVPDFVVSDVSFISLKLALPPALDLVRSGGFAILLAKPQFEVGKKALGKGGIVRSADDAMKAAVELEAWLNIQPGWHSTHLLPSPVKGGDGNREFLLCGRKL